MAEETISQEIEELLQSQAWVAERVRVLRGRLATNIPAGSGVEVSHVAGEQSLLDAPLTEIEGERLPLPIDSMPAQGNANYPSDSPPPQDAPEQDRVRASGLGEGETSPSREYIETRAIRIETYQMEPYQLCREMDRNGLNPNGGIEILIDRYARFRIRTEVGTDWADWDAETDCVKPWEGPGTISGSKSTVLVDATPENVRHNTSSSSKLPLPLQDHSIPAQQSPRLEHSSPYIPSHTSTHNPRNTLTQDLLLMDTHTQDTSRPDRRDYISETHLDCSEAWQSRSGGLPTGQSRGRYRDPISMEQEPTGMVSQLGQMTAYAEEAAPRKSMVTFAEAPVIIHQMRASTPTPELIQLNPPCQPNYSLARTQTNSSSGNGERHSFPPLPQIQPTTITQPNPPDTHYRQFLMIPATSTHPTQLSATTQINPPDTQRYLLPATLDALDPQTRFPLAVQTNSTAVTSQVTNTLMASPSYSYQLPHSTPYAPPHDQTYQRPQTLYSDGTRTQNPNSTYPVTNPAYPRTQEPAPHPPFQSYYEHGGHAPHYRSRVESTERSSVTAGFVPYQGRGGNRMMYSEKVSKCGAYLRAGKVGFDGAGGNADEFLRRVKEAVEMFALTDEECVGVLPYVLDGHALDWYRADKGDWRCYEDFVERFRRCYSNLGSGSRIWEEILERTQGANEPLATYLASLQILFSRLTKPVPIAVQLDIAFDNLHPKYMAAMRRTEVKSFNDLHMLGQEYEERLRRMARYVPPKGPEKSLVPSAAYAGKSKRSERVAAVSQTAECQVNATMIPHAPAEPQKPRNKVQEVGTQTTLYPSKPAPPRQILTCFNCGQRGHFRRECPKGRTGGVQGNERRDQ